MKCSRYYLEGSAKKDEIVTFWEAFQKWHNAMGEYWYNTIKPFNLDVDYMLDLVCDTDPNIWLGECSADPAIYEDLMTLTHRTGDEKMNAFVAYTEIKEAFEKIFNGSPEYLEAFQQAKDAITFEMWIEF